MTPDLNPLPSTQGRRVQLRPLGGRDYEALRLMELSDELGARWRLHGGTPDPDSFLQSASAGVIAQFLVVPRSAVGTQAGAEAPMGIVTSYGANFQSGYAYIAAAKFARSVPSSMFIEGVAVFIEYVFACWAFRKLYAEVDEFNLPQFASVLESLFREEGRLREHTFLADRYWDRHILALYRSSWSTEVRPSLMRFLHRGGSSDSPMPSTLRAQA